jgi:uncharacterized protein
VTRLRRLAWAAGWPARALLLGAIAAYRVALSPLLGGRCRFHPSCSEYARDAIRNVGALRGSGLAVWRILRCSPLSAGGVDYPPGRRVQYDSIVQSGVTGRWGRISGEVRQP